MIDRTPSPAQPSCSPTARTGSAALEAAFVPNARGRWYCDLVGLARLRLAGLGIGDPYGGQWCTFAAAAHFFSHRRDGRTGRMAALIWLTEAPTTGADA